MTIKKMPEFKSRLDGPIEIGLFILLVVGLVVMLARSL
jgi:hypothetical protein